MAWRPASERLVTTLLCSGSLIGGLTTGCRQRPLVITEPAAVTVESRENAPPRAIPRTYSTFWAAFTALDPRAAHTLSEHDEQRAMADVLAALVNGEMTRAETGAEILLTARDTLVRQSARVTYGALLSARGAWSTLARLAAAHPLDTTARHPIVPRDAAGVEAWAAAFSSVRTTFIFTDSVRVVSLTRSASGAPLIDVIINGVTRRFWLDTGTSLTILSAPAAAACGVAPINADTLELFTVVGRLPARPATVRALEIGGLRVHDAPAMIVDADTLVLRTGTNDARGSTRSDERIDGIIGFDVLRRLDLTLDYGRGRATVAQPVRDTTPRPRNLLWFGLPIVTAYTAGGTPVHFALDTGADETYAAVSLVQKTGARTTVAERRLVHGFGGTRSERGYVIPQLHLTIGDARVMLQRVFIYDARYPTIFTIDGTLGGAIDAGRGGGAVMRIDMTNGRFSVDANQ